MPCLVRQMLFLPGRKMDVRSLRKGMRLQLRRPRRIAVHPDIVHRHPRQRLDALFQLVGQPGPVRRRDRLTLDRAARRLPRQPRTQRLQRDHPRLRVEAAGGAGERGTRHAARRHRLRHDGGPVGHVSCGMVGHGTSQRA